MMQLTFESIDNMVAWMDRARDTLMRRSLCAVTFAHRAECPTLGGDRTARRATEDQACACRPRPTLAIRNEPEGAR